MPAARSPDPAAVVRRQNASPSPTAEAAQQCYQSFGILLILLCDAVLATHRGLNPFGADDLGAANNVAHFDKKAVRAVRRPGHHAARAGPGVPGFVRERVPGAPELCTGSRVRARRG